MKKSLKGALLSGLVFPGAGQLWLKHYIRGIALLVTVAASLAVIAAQAVRQAFAILEKIESEGGSVDLVAILSSASQASTASGGLITKLAWTALMLSWIISTIDAYYLGRKRDLAEQAGDRAARRRDTPD